jgi:hypothetical protein
VTIKAYADSSIVLKSTIRETYTYDVKPTGSSSSLVINPIDPSGANTIAVAGCPVTCLLQKLDASNNWVDFTSTSQLAFVAATGALTIDFDLADAFWTGAAALNEQRTTYTLRVGVQYNALLPNFDVFDDFDLVMQHYCYSDKLFLTSHTADFTQTIFATDQGTSDFGHKSVVLSDVDN